MDWEQFKHPDMVKKVCEDIAKNCLPAVSELIQQCLKMVDAEVNRLTDVVTAVIAYDNAIQKRVVDGAVQIIATGGGVAMGDDLDALYDDMVAKARR